MRVKNYNLILTCVWKTDVLSELAFQNTVGPEINAIILLMQKMRFKVIRINNITHLFF